MLSNDQYTEQQNKFRALATILGDYYNVSNHGLAPEMKKYLDFFIDFEHAEVYEVLIALAYYKECHPQTDMVTIPYSIEGQKFFSKVIAPVLAELDIPHSNTDNTWYLPCFSPEDYVDEEGKLDPGHHKSMFYALVALIDRSVSDAKNVMLYLLNAPSKGKRRPLDHKATISKLATIQRFLDVLHARLATEGLETIKEKIVYYAFYACYLMHLKEIPEYKDCKLSPRNIALHPEIPAQNGFIEVHYLGGDVDPYIKEIVEVKYLPVVTLESMLYGKSLALGTGAKHYHIYSKQIKTNKNQKQIAQIIEELAAKKVEMQVYYLCTFLEFHLNLVSDLSYLHTVYDILLAQDDEITDEMIEIAKKVSLEYPPVI